METIWNVPRIELKDLATVKETRRVALITGQQAWRMVGPSLNLPVVVQAEPQNAQQRALDDLAQNLPKQTEVVYGVGGGLVADVAKYVAWKNNLPVVLIPTVLSVDGFFTALVAVRRSGTVAYETTGPAEKVIVDLSVVSAAPAHLRGTGIVEILSMTTGLLDWKYAADHQRNTPQERYQLWAAQLAAGIAQQAYRIARGVGEGRTEQLRSLLDLIMVEVQLTNQIGHNRPQEGSEQYFAYAIEPRVVRDRGIPYADLVGPGILIAAALHKQNVTPIRETLLSAGVRLDQLPKSDIRFTLQELPDYATEHQLPFSIVHTTRLDDEAIEGLIDTTGIGY